MRRFLLDVTKSMWLKIKDIEEVKTKEEDEKKQKMLTKTEEDA